MFLEWKSDGETPSKPTFEGAIAFWTGKNPRESYEWMKADVCACGQYAEAIGDKSWMKRDDRTTLVLWERLNTLASYQPHTFGDLVERAKKDKVLCENC